MKKAFFCLFICFSFLETAAQVANPVSDNIICELPFDGIAEFDLTINDAEVLGGQSPADYIVSYHQSQADAEIGINQLVSPYTNVINPQVIYIRVEELATGNFDTTDFDLIVYASPPDLGPFEFYLCDDDLNGSTTDDEISTFDLTSKDEEVAGGNSELEVIWFETVEDEMNNFPIVDPTAYQNLVNPQSIIGRVVNVNTDCRNIISLTLTVLPNPTPNTNTTPLEYCDDDGDGIGEFDLTLKDVEITGGEPDVSVSYYETLQNAEEAINPLSSPYVNIVPFSQTVYARVTRDVPPAVLPCYSIVELELTIVEDCLVIDIEPSDIYIDEGDKNGLALFDLTVNEDQMIGDYDPTQFLFSYHSTYQDSEMATNAVQNPEEYQNIANPQTIYVRFYDSAGSAFALVNFEIETDGVLSLENQPFADLSIYPNPVSEIIKVSASLLISETIIEVFDISGKSILSEEKSPVNGFLETDLSSLKCGVYFLKISSEGNSITKKVIKK